MYCAFNDSGKVVLAKRELANIIARAKVKTFEEKFIIKELPSYPDGTYYIASRIPDDIHDYIFTVGYDCDCGNIMPVSFEYGNGVGTPTPDKYVCSKCSMSIDNKYVALFNLGLNLEFKPFFSFKK